MRRLNSIILFSILLISLSSCSNNSGHSNDPTTSDPTTNDPTTNDPTTNDPTTNDPTTNDPTTSDPTTNDPIKRNPKGLPPENLVYFKANPIGSNDGAWYKDSSSQLWYVKKEKYNATQSANEAIVSEIYFHLGYRVPITFVITDQIQDPSDPSLKVTRVSAAKKLKNIDTNPTMNIVNRPDLADSSKMRKLRPIIAILKDWDRTANAENSFLGSPNLADFAIIDFGGALGMRAQGEYKNATNCQSPLPSNPVFKYVGCFEQDINFKKIYDDFRPAVLSDPNHPFNKELSVEEKRDLIKKFDLLIPKIDSIVDEGKYPNTNTASWMKKALKLRFLGARDYYKSQIHFIDESDYTQSIAYRAHRDDLETYKQNLSQDMPNDNRVVSFKTRLSDKEDVSKAERQNFELLNPPEIISLHDLFPNGLNNVKFLNPNLLKDQFLNADSVKDVVPNKEGQSLIKKLKNGDLHPTAISAGCIIEEEDNRIWLTSPWEKRNDVQNTFPEGRVNGSTKALKDSDFTEEKIQKVAVEKTLELTGLKTTIIDYIGDFQKNDTITRYYLCKRLYGNPSYANWKTQDVRLVPQNRLKEYLISLSNEPNVRDHKIANRIFKISAEKKLKNVFKKKLLTLGKKIIINQDHMNDKQITTYRKISVSNNPTIFNEAKNTIFNIGIVSPLAYRTQSGHIIKENIDLHIQNAKNSPYISTTKQLGIAFESKFQSYDNKKPDYIILVIDNPEKSGLDLMALNHDQRLKWKYNMYSFEDEFARINFIPKEEVKGFYFISKNSQDNTQYNHQNGKKYYFKEYFPNPNYIKPRPYKKILNKFVIVY